MTIDLLLLGLGVAAAAGGGELFVRGAVGLARWVRVPEGIVAATIAAFATSSPELAVAITSGLSGTPEVALGDALGSNVVNIGLILGAALLISGIHTSRDSIKRDFPVALLVPVLIGILGFDGVLSRVDGALLMGTFLTWMAVVVVETLRQRSRSGAADERASGLLTVVLCLGGLALLIAAGRLIVSGATGLAAALGLGPFVIGATVVAIGTSVPELATTIVSKLRGHDEVGLGTVLGSNIFNGFWIVAWAALLSPIRVDWGEVVVGLGFGVLTVAFTFPSRNGMIERRRGALLVAFYAVYVGTLLQQR